MATRRGWRRAWRYGRALVAPALISLLLVAAVIDPLSTWLRAEDSFDRAALSEWLEEARFPNQTLHDLVEDYFQRLRDYSEAPAEPNDAPGGDDWVSGGGRGFKRTHLRERVSVKKEEIFQHLRALGEPPTKIPGVQLPLFPVIYRLELTFDFSGLPDAEREPLYEGGPRMDSPVVWDAGLPGEDRPEEARRVQSKATARDASFDIHPRAAVKVRYQLHAFNKRQRIEQDQAARLRQLSLLALAAMALALALVLLQQGREREQERHRQLAREQVDQAERQLLQEQVARQAAERQALELRSHLYASIGIMAGSYAHNIKNLLVRPNDLLRRCLELGQLPAGSEGMVREVQQTLGTVTERLQQILHTVRRDPSQAELRPLDLNAVLRGLGQTWSELARDRWKLDLALELGAGEPLWVVADLSHLQQAIENLLFNARDATFEMRIHLREAAHRSGSLDPAARKQAVIAAASWRGQVVLRTGTADRDGAVVLEVCDNGAGMTEEVRRRCTETHFSTKRDNALYEGNSTGMGLGLSFVVAILEHHHARLEIESVPLGGTTFRVHFPAARAPAAAEAGRGAFVADGRGAPAR
jgi:signal transduction histidine kinase